MAKPTDWKPTRDGQGRTRTTSRGNTIHEQDTPNGRVPHLVRPDGTSERLRSQTIDPTHTKKPE